MASLRWGAQENTPRPEGMLEAAAWPDWEDPKWGFSLGAWGDWIFHLPLSFPCLGLQGRLPWLRTQAPPRSRSVTLDMSLKLGLGFSPCQMPAGVQWALQKLPCWPPTRARVAGQGVSAAGS